MKSKRILPDMNEMMPLLIQTWRKFRKEGGPSDKLQTREFRNVVETVSKLRKGIEESDTLIGTDYFAEPNYLSCYLLYQWVISYQEALSVIGELPFNPQRVLDICSGPIPMGFAALKHGAQEVVATDRNMQALELGAEICGRSGYPVSIRKWNSLREQNLIEGQFDLIIIGHSLEELFPSTQKGWLDDQQRFLNKLLYKLTDNGCLVIIEDSLPNFNKRVLEIRERFVKDNVPVQAPCVWRGTCPALQTPNSPCYAQREFEKPYLIKEIQRGAQINLGSLKMSYLIVRNPKSGWPTLPENDLYRIISPPVDSQQGKSYYLCGTEGKKKLSSHMQEQPIQARAFDYLKRGELISIRNPLKTVNSLEIVEGTEVKVEAACGKPIPEKRDF